MVAATKQEYTPIKIPVVSRRRFLHHTAAGVYAAIYPLVPKWNMGTREIR
jgi:hypothetical protein